MPDGHWGYGFPIGGVAAFDVRTGIISPGGVGYDVNCGMRLMRTNLTQKDVQPIARTIDDGIVSESAGRGWGERVCTAWIARRSRMSWLRGARWCIDRGLWVASRS